jgi:hypothetical protein
MTSTSARRAERLPRGVWSSTAVGMSAAGIAWLFSGAMTALTSSFSRLDQLTAIIFGAVTGAGILGVRAFRRREPVWFGAVAGTLLGGVGALAGASILAFDHGAIAPRWFVVERVLTWSLTATGAAALLALSISRRRTAWLRESIVLAAIGGATAGAVFTLPGAPDAWQAIACVWFGGTVAFAVSGPELWHAFAVIEIAPPKGRRWNPFLMREWPLHDEASVGLGEALIACRGGSVALYPPAGGLVSNGHAVRQPQRVEENAMVVVGRARYHIQLVRAT